MGRPGLGRRCSCGHPLILRAAARHAAVVALSGLGRTLPDGHGPSCTATCNSSGKARPGETVQVTVALGKPVALDAGQTFAIREGGRTVGAGTVTTLLD